MAYVGTPIDTQNQFQSLQGKRFNGDGSTTAFTLDIAPSSVFDIEVFVENVRQDPNSAYGISGTTLTFTGAPPSGTNNIYVVHQAKAVGTIDVPASGVVPASLASNIISGQTELAAAPADTDEFLISDAGTIKRIDYSYIKGDTNVPAFAAKLASAQSISHETATKIAFATEIFDSDSKYDTSNYRFTPGVAGKYFIFVRVGYQEHNTSSGSLTDQAGLFARIYKNGSSVADAGNHSSVSSLQSVISSTATVIVDLDADDYVEAYTLQQNNNSNNAANLLSNEAYNTFGGFRIAGT